MSGNRRGKVKELPSTVPVCGSSEGKCGSSDGNLHATLNLKKTKKQSLWWPCQHNIYDVHA